MDKKYWVPALERADAVLKQIAARPGQLKMIDLSRELGIHKSSMFSLLHTLEQLEWVVRDKADTFSLGPGLARFGSLFLQQFSFTQLFNREAPATKAQVGQTVQLARLDGRDVVYLAKVEADEPVRLVSDPGMRMPAHATALGKAMLAQLDDESLHALFPEPQLPALTPNTITSRDELFRHLRTVREQGLAYDRQEAVIGFCCVGAPVFDERGNAAAAVSISMPLYQWERKEQLAVRAILELANRLSFPDHTDKE